MESKILKQNSIHSKMNCISLLFVSCIFSTCVAIAPFIPNDKEAVYDYSAIIKSATDIPERFVSEFHLFAKLHIQSPSNTSLLIQLQNITFRVYNGQTKVGYKQESHDLPINVSEIMRPFEIILNGNGQVESITMDKSEKLYARNMHKALGALLQLKLNDISFSSNKSDTFVTREHSIYGQGRSVYTILPSNDELIIKKMRESVSTKRLYQLETTNFEGDTCEATYEEPLAHDSHQVYTFRKVDDSYTLKHIESNGGLYFYPFRAKSEAHYIHSSVRLNFICFTSIASPIQIQDGKSERDLTYDAFEPNLQMEESFYNVLTDDQTILSVLKTILSDVLLYLDKNHMRTDDIDIRKAHLITSAIRLLRTCSLNKLANIFHNLKSDDSVNGQRCLRVFLEAAPFVGTHSSVVFVKNLVRDRKVDDDLSLDMIEVVASYVRFPTEALLRDTEDMLTWGNEINKNVQKAAALSFGTLIHKTFKSEVALSNREHEDRESSTSSESETINTFLSKHSIYKELTDKLVNKLKSSVDVESQLLYLQVLFNTKLPLAVAHLIPIVKGSELNSHDVREMAFWALSQLVVGDTDLIAKLYWPIVTDRNQHTELRIAAYYVIIKSRPSLTGMLSMHYVMKEETNTEVYNFHYTYLKATSESENPCNQISKLSAAQILKFTRKPNQQALSTYYQTQFTDKKYGHGLEVNNIYISAARSRIFASEITMQIFNKRSNYYLLFFKIGGLEKQLSRTLEFNLKNSFGLLNYAELWEMISSVRDMKEFHIQISISNNYHTVQIYYFDKTNLHEFIGIWKRLLEDKFVLNKKVLNFNYEDATEIIFPTEIGMPASYEMFLPSVTYKYLNVETKVDNNITTFLLDCKFQGLRSISWGLEFYNPIIGVSQGVKRYHAYDSVLPLFMEISINREEQSLTIVWKAHPDNEANVIGLRSYVTNFVYVENYVNSDVLQASCAKCENWVQVTRGDPYRFNYTLLYDDGSTSGFASKGLIFDTERHASTDSLNVLIQGANRNKNITLLESFLTLLRNFRLSDLFQPSAGTQGFLFIIYPAVTQTEVTFSFKEEITQHKNEFLPAIKFNPHMKYQLRNNNSVVKTLDVNILMETNVGHTLKTLKADVLFTGQNLQDYKLWVKGDKIWTKEGVTSRIVLSRSGTESYDDVILDVKMIGEQLAEQKTPFHVYEVCDTYSHNFNSDYHSMRCLAEHTSIRKYIYEIQTHHEVSLEQKDIIKDLLFFFLDKYKANHNYYSNNDDNEIGSSIKILIEYTNENNANVKVITPEGTHYLNTVSTSDLLWFGLTPDNTHFSTFFVSMNYFGMVHTCTVSIDKIQHEFNEEKQIEKFGVGLEWTMVIGDAEVNPQQAVFLKKYGDGMLSLKLVYENQTLEIYPVDDLGEQFKIIFDGKEMSQIMDHYKEDWFSYVIRPHLKSIIITIFHFQLHLDYTADQLIVQVPKVNGISMSGPCVRRDGSTKLIV